MPKAKLYNYLAIKKEKQQRCTENASLLFFFFRTVALPHGSQFVPMRSNTSQRGFYYF